MSLGEQQWALRRSIELRALLPYFAGGALTVAPGVYLLLNTPTTIYVLALGGFLTAYGLYMLLGSPPPAAAQPP